MTEKETPQQTVIRLTAELAAANKTIEGFKNRAAMASADEQLIVEKMSFGLSRAQAVEVIKRQRVNPVRSKLQPT